MAAKRHRRLRQKQKKCGRKKRRERDNEPKAMGPAIPQVPGRKSYRLKRIDAFKRKALLKESTEFSESL